MKSLPKQPNLAYLQREARTLRAKHRARDKSITGVIGHYDTSFHGLSQEEVFARKFSIIDAQRVTARLYCFASWRRLKLFVQSTTVKTDKYDPRLRYTLLRRMEARAELIRRTKDHKDDSTDSIYEFDVASQNIVKHIYDCYGWPGPQLVGRDGAEACYCLALSHSANSQFQYACAMLMKDALPRGECPGNLYAFTVDRWLCLSYQPQIYGSFKDFNLEIGRVEYGNNVIDPGNLNKRRAEVGLRDIDVVNNELDAQLIERKRSKYGHHEWETRKRQLALKHGYIS